MFLHDPLHCSDFVLVHYDAFLEARVVHSLLVFECAYLIQGGILFFLELLLLGFYKIQEGVQFPHDTLFNVPVAEGEVLFNSHFLHDVLGPLAIFDLTVD